MLARLDCLVVQSSLFRIQFKYMTIFINDASSLIKAGSILPIPTYTYDTLVSMWASYILLTRDL